MKKIFILMGYLAIIFAVYSCDFFEEKSSSEEIENFQTMEGLPESVKQKIVAQDSLMSELVNKVDTLTVNLNALQEENKALKDKIEDLKSPKSFWGWTSIVAVVISIIAVLLALVIRSFSEKKLNKVVSNRMSSSKEMKGFNNRLLQLEESVGQYSKSLYANKSYIIGLETRLVQLERQMIQLRTSIDKKNASSNLPQNAELLPQEKANKFEYQKIGYAMIDADVYFTKVYESNQEGCVFKINFVSPTKGIFNILSLEKIQSRNDWQKKIEYSGASIKDATDFRVEDEGICEKLDENVWQVVKPLKLKLLK